MDVGQPKDFVIGSTLYLDHVSKTKPEMLCKHESCIGMNLCIVHTTLLHTVVHMYFILRSTYYCDA